MKIKQIEWSEPREPNASCSYDHVVGKCPLGDYLIDWKGWKESPSFGINSPVTPYIDCRYSLKEAKEYAQDDFEYNVRECLIED